MNNELARSQANNRNHSTLVAPHQIERESFYPEILGDVLHGCIRCLAQCFFSGPLCQARRDGAGL